MDLRSPLDRPQGDELVPACRAGSGSTVLCVVYLLAAELSDGSGEDDGYPFGLPAVRALSEIEFAPVTVFVGDNSTGTLVGLWRTFLARPDRYFRHLFDESAD